MIKKTKDLSKSFQDALKAFGYLGEDIFITHIRRDIKLTRLVDTRNCMVNMKSGDFDIQKGAVFFDPAPNFAVIVGTHKCATILVHSDSYQAFTID